MGEFRMNNGRIFNFSAGPAILPDAVLETAAAEMLNYKGSGMSVMEMSHRGKIYDAIFEDTLAKLRRIMAVPDTHAILLLQGGATLQFYMTALNLLPIKGKADYAITGSFSKKAYQEACKFGTWRIACTSPGLSPDFSVKTSIPTQKELDLDPGASYFHYCMNNTIFGSAWNYIPDTGDVPLVCDMSSCILSTPLDVSKFGLIYAGAQKNMGPAGLTVVIVRKDLVGYAPKETAAMLDYAVMVKNNSMLNTPPTYGVYLLGLVLDWIETMGGLTAMEKHNVEKAALLYDYLDQSGRFLLKAEKCSRSIMNVVFSTGDEAKDAAFLKLAESKGLSTLKAHKETGGIRASIYNAMPRAGVEALVACLKDFEANA
jgi:phosphoserine aminotransferase